MMEDSNGTEFSKTSPNSDKNEDEDENTSTKDGGSSTNSTIEGGVKKFTVRPYVRSKMVRLRWTPELHRRFVHTVERLGGHGRATPKLILQLMNIKGLNIAHVKSHLQMYRSKKIDDPAQGSTNHHKLFMESGDPFIYNLSQLPMLSSFNQIFNSTLRYGDVSSRNFQDNNSMHSFIMGQSTIAKARKTCYTTHNEKIFGSNHIDKPTPLFHIAEKSQTRILSPLKRKAMHCDLIDLNLSLGVKPKKNSHDDDDEDDDDDGSTLTLSLSSQRYPSRLKEDTNYATIENARRGTSTLDLTL